MLTSMAQPFSFRFSDDDIDGDSEEDTLTEGECIQIRSRDDEAVSAQPRLHRVEDIVS